MTQARSRSSTYRIGESLSLRTTFDVGEHAKTAAFPPHRPQSRLKRAGDCQACKPHPEAYLNAAARLNVDTACCVAIEDSPSGTLSAEAAGIPVVVVPGVVPVPAAPNRQFTASLTALSVADWSGVVDRNRP